MLELQLSDKTELRLKRVLSMSENNDVFFNKAIDYQINELKKGIFNIEKDLKYFEEKYNLSSKLFYKKFSNGEIGDEDDYIIWGGIYEMYLSDKQKLKKL
jgi:hypothetical protein